MTASGDTESQKAENSAVLCLAVVRDDFSDVVVFDAKGEPKAFSFKELLTKKADGKICFSAHGHDTDDFLTPCFDEEGNFGEPEESCFCGIDEPHLHAHWHDPKTCDAQKGSLADIKAEDVLMKLAKLTLEPLDEDETMPMLSLGISEHMPNACNATELYTNLMENGHHVSAMQRRRRLHKVQVRIQFIETIVFFYKWVL